MILYKKLILESLLNHLKNNSRKYLTGAGVTTGMGLAQLGDSPEELNSNNVTNNVTNNNTNWNDVAKTGLLGAAGIGTALMVTKKGINSTLNIADKLNTKIGQTVQNGINSSSAGLSKGFNSTQQWIKEEKRKENPPPKGVDTGMVHGPRLRNTVFDKTVSNTRDLNKPTKVAIEIRNKPLSQPGDIKKKLEPNSFRIVPKRIINKRKNRDILHKKIQELKNEITIK